MKKIEFQFQNQDIFPHQLRERSWFPIKQLILFMFFFVSAISFCFKYFYSFSFKTNFASQAEHQREQAHVIPLWVSLKGQKGPQLAKVSVFIHLGSKELQKYFEKQIYTSVQKNEVIKPKEFQKYFEKQKLEKQLVFLLSGQPISILSNREFQNQLQNQLNIFLTDRIINNLNIKTEMLN